MELGLLLIDSKDTRETLMPCPKACISQLEEVIPTTIRDRTDDAKKWL
jgi:hypothetical protein